MLNFKSKTLSEQELMVQLKAVIEKCETADFKTKKFIGLLYDYIPYNNGLKTRLELIGKTGYMENLIKFGKDSESNSKKIERFSVQIASEYGFRPEVMMNTFKMLANAFDIPIQVDNGEIEGSKIISNAVRGNFSKNHRRDEVELEVKPLKTEQSLSPNSGSQKKTFKPRTRKPWIRNRGNLFLMILFLIVMVGGEFYLNDLFGNTDVVFRSLKVTVTTWWYVLIAVSGLITLVVNIGYKKFKTNLVNFFPIVMLILQLVGIVFKVEMPTLYENAQVAIFSMLFMSFTFTTGYAVRLPKGAKDFIAYKAINSYYATGILFLLGQYLVRISV